MSGMQLTVLVLICSVLIFDVNASCCGDSDPFLYDTFPKDFKWATATAAYQIEGGWDLDGKGENIWDNFSHKYCCVEKNATGDVACDSYHKWREDIKLMKELGTSYYRFSISWARIMPDGTNATINQKGIDWYKTFLMELKKAGIKPMATLYHWDLPQNLQEKYGGWENEILVDFFKEYARVCFEHFGEYVPRWLTFNEPWVVAWLGYGVGAFAPGVKKPGTAPYNAAHTMIKAHAEAWHLYNTTYRSKYNGVVSITLNSDYKEPKTQSQQDKEAAERAQQFALGWFAHPIYSKEGDYPKVMIDAVQKKSQTEGLAKSRLPKFTEEEKKRIRGTFDYFGLNHYSTQWINYNSTGRNTPSYEYDQDMEDTIDYTNWPSSGADWLYVVPWGFRKLLNWIKKEYDNPPVFVTENGMSDRNQTIEGIFNDTHRIFFYKHYINNMLKAIKKDKCNVIGYAAWSLMDNFEWSRGYEEKFGLFYVNFSDPNRPRMWKDSARYYQQLIKDNGFPKSGPTSSSETVNFGALTVVIPLFLNLLWH